MEGESEGFYGGPQGTTRRIGEMLGSCWLSREREEDGICDEGDSRIRRE